MLLYVFTAAERSQQLMLVHEDGLLFPPQPVIKRAVQQAFRSERDLPSKYVSRYIHLFQLLIYAAHGDRIASWPKLLIGACCPRP